VLRFEPDSWLADWFARRDEPWGELVTMGPAGLESYARVRYLEEDRISGRVLFARVRVHLAGRTKTPGDCFHGLWVGAVSAMHGDPARGISPWFPASVWLARRSVSPIGSTCSFAAILTKPLATQVSNRDST
jgi:hypothetical protein